jgi:hypothetical protein
MGHVEVTEVVMHDTIVGTIERPVATLHVIGNVHDMIDETPHIVVHIIEVVQSTDNVEATDLVMHDQVQMIIDKQAVEQIVNGYVIDSTDETLSHVSNIMVTVL